MKMVIHILGAAVIYLTTLGLFYTVVGLIAWFNNCGGFTSC